MDNKNIIIAGAVAIVLYILSQPKKIYAATAQKVAQRIRPPAPRTIRQRTAQKIAQKVAQKVAPKRIGQPTTWLAYIAAKRKAAIRKAAAQKIGKKIGKTVAQKIVPKRIGQPTTWLEFIAAKRKAGARKAAARKAAIRKAAIRKAALRKAAARKAALRKAAARKAATRKAAAQKIGKKIGKTVAQKIIQNLKTRRAVIAQHAKRQRPQIQRPRLYKKKIATRLFSGAEKSRIIPYSESSKHSYYGPKSHKLFNEGYQSNKGYAKSIEANHDRVVREVLSNPKLWNRWPEGRKP